MLDEARVVRYQGRIDDQYGVGFARKTPEHNELKDAIDALLAGRSVAVARTQPVGCLIGRAHEPQPNAEVTYANQIARLFNKRCVECHHAGDIAPFSLTSYEDAAAWADMIAEVVDQGRMPPWHADPKYGHFSDDRRLSDDEKRLIHAWVAAGAAGRSERTAADADFCRQRLAAETAARPDPADERQTLSGQSRRRAELSDLPRRPPFHRGQVDRGGGGSSGQSSRRAPCARARARPGRARMAAVRRTRVFGRVRPRTARRCYPKGMAKRISAGSKLNFQIHYTPNGSKQEDITRIGLWFADPKQVTHEVRTIAAVNPLFVIPAGADNQPVEASTQRLPSDAQILSFMPHMHLRGKSFLYEAVYANGKRETLLDVPKYDFNWQTAYRVEQPLKFPKGTKIHAVAHFDNSTDNLNNPNPKRIVFWGEQTYEEMMIGYFDMATPRGSRSSEDSRPRPRSRRLWRFRPLGRGCAQEPGQAARREQRRQDHTRRGPRAATRPVRPDQRRQGLGDRRATPENALPLPPPRRGLIKRVPHRAVATPVTRFAGLGRLAAAGAVRRICVSGAGALATAADAGSHAVSHGGSTHVPLTEHPRLYFTSADLPKLRRARTQGVHARIWKNLTESADWCARQTPRTEWIPTISPDPIYQNLYDRFYAAMHDMAIVEHLAFASALSDPEHDTYFEPARSWALACAKIWKNEANNKPDASKAYAVLRIMKGLAVSYDLLYPRLNATERAQIRETLVAVGHAYFQFFADPVAAGPGYNKHHGSVDAGPMGVVALALLGEVPEAQAWLDRMIEKHVHYLLPYALTPSGTNDQSSNFWASTLHYRIFFMDALRRVTGRDLFAEFPDALPGRIALAAVAGKLPRDVFYNETDKTVLFAPDYGQIDYWAPDLLFMAREQRRPIYQHLALWDESLGKIQHTRFITPQKKVELLFEFGGFAYVWYDPSVPDEIEPGLPRAFEFPEPEVNEAYLRDSYRAGDIVVGFKKGSLIVYAGGRPVLVDQLDVGNTDKPGPAVDELLVADDGRLAMIRCVGPKGAGVKEQRVELHRPGRLTIRRERSGNMSWWYMGEARRDKNTLRWPDGTTLSVTVGTLENVQPAGNTEKKVHFGGMVFADPHPFSYPVVTARPERDVLEITITVQK